MDIVIYTTLHPAPLQWRHPRYIKYVYSIIKQIIYIPWNMTLYVFNCFYSYIYKVLYIKSSLSILYNIVMFGQNGMR